MELEEGQLLRGTVSISGGDDGPCATWIVVAPHGKYHIHSIDNPLDLHCWPVYSAVHGLESGSMELLEVEPDHPMVQLQRAKERHGVEDAHLGLQDQMLDRMLLLLEEAVDTSAPYAHFAAGEILALTRRVILSGELRQQLEAQVHLLLNRLNG